MWYQRRVRRHPTLALVATAVALGVVLVWPSIDRDARTPIPAGAVLEATSLRSDGPMAGPSGTVAAIPTAATPTAQPSAPTPGAATPGASPSIEVPASPSIAPSPEPSPAVLAIRSGPTVARGLEGERPGRAEPDAAPDPKTLTGYRWPVAQVRISNPFGPSWFGDSLVGDERFHDGIDLATFCGDRIVAAHDGIVLTAGRRFDPFVGWVGSIARHTALMDQTHHWGALPIVVIIDDGNGYRSIYAHFNALATGLRPGRRVHAGQFLGWEGATGFASGCHLHYGLFSPYETARFRLRPDVVRKTHYPAWQIARIDPLLVLPHRPPRPAPSPTAKP